MPHPQRLAPPFPVLLLLALSCQPSAQETAGTETGVEETAIEDTGSDPGDTALENDLYGVAGSDGAWLWFEGTACEDAILQRADGEAWSDLTAAGEDTSWYDPDGTTDHRYRLVDAHGTPLSNEVQPAAVEGTLTADHPDSIYHKGETIALSLVLVPPDPLPTLELGLSYEDTDDGDLLWFDAACLHDEDQDCWTATPGAIQEVSADDTEISLPAFTAATNSLDRASLTAHLGWHDDDTFQTVHAASVPLIFTGRFFAWGDPHAHSNLSYDGCEMKDDGCGDRLERAGADFFDQARDAGLDWAALTDHAEYVEYCPEGESGDCIDIWDETEALVAAADSDDFVPILGYEWTWNGGGSASGGHKTVLLNALEACDRYVVASAYNTTPFEKQINGEQYYGPNDAYATNTSDFFSALGAAGNHCGELEVLTFFHHSALRSPEDVDWTDAGNTPDDRYEHLVEVFSEHGSSECADTEAEGCDWNLPSDLEIYEGETGSVQTALSMGYTLGFVGGTDSHDSMPGSLDDGGSCTARWSDQDGDGIYESLRCHDYDGALTGVMLKGELARDTLFAAMGGRHTVATSGPRLDVRVLAEDPEGDLHLPGDVLDSDTSELLIRASVEGLLDEEGLELVSWQIVAADGSLLAESTETTLEETLSTESGDTLYARLLLEDLDGEAHRIVVSPFFVASAG